MISQRIGERTLDLWQRELSDSVTGSQGAGRDKDTETDALPWRGDGAMW